ncbi:MAG: tail fiber protein [Arenimonas sp.]|nr:tail fiber protein [Arenimonas sp.]
MSEFFIGQVMMAGFNFAPRFWALCNGQLLPINQNQALFSLMGTQYGGNGTTNFALPDLRSRTPIGYASSVDPSWQPPAVQIGQSAGVENVTLLSTNLPAHTHTLNVTTAAGTTRNPNNAVYASTSVLLHGPSTGPLVPQNPSTIAPTGGNQPHPNLQPYSVLNFCVALSGIFPSRN